MVTITFIFSTVIYLFQPNQWSHYDFSMVVLVLVNWITPVIYCNIRDMLDVEYPEAALIAEWNGPRMSLKNGFDMDFYLDWQGNGYSWLMRNYDGAIDSAPHNIGKAYFCADSGTGIDKFLHDWLPSYKATRKDGLYCLITCNHDTIRPSAGLTPDELKIAYAMLFTLPGAPYLY